MEAGVSGSDSSYLRIAGTRPHQSLSATTLGSIDTQGVSVMRLWKLIPTRWFQFRDEVVGIIRGFQLLIVNLALIGKLRPVGSEPITVIVDSWREATILRLLWVTQLLPRHKILVVRHACDLHMLMQSNFGGESLLIVTSRAYIKYYQFLASLRHQQRMFVL